MRKGGGLSDSSSVCLMHAWGEHQADLRGWLRHRLPDAATAQDLLQDVFLKALRQGEAFCNVANARAWLFEVARNTLVDHLRREHPTEYWTDAQLDGLPQPVETKAVVDQLTDCLRRVLDELDEADAHIIRQCDLNGQRQQDYAAVHGLSLPATKAKLRRARERLRLAMTVSCQIQPLPGGGVDDFVPRP